MLHPNIGYAVEIVMSRAHSTIWRPMEMATATLIHATFDCVFEYFFSAALFCDCRTKPLRSKYPSIEWYSIWIFCDETHGERERRDGKTFTLICNLYSSTEWIRSCPGRLTLDFCVLVFMLLALKICPVDLFCLLKPEKMTFFVRSVFVFLCFACACVYWCVLDFTYLSNARNLFHI